MRDPELKPCRMAAPAWRRFRAKYQERESGCWVWTGALQARGYGNFLLEGRNVLAHRASYEHHVGEIPNEQQLDHLCRNRACVNPAHLEVVSSRENTMRGVGPTAVNASRARCIHGHLLLGRDVAIRPNGRRKCLVCDREAKRRNRAALAAREET